jgi:hypothetical protein
MGHYQKERERERKGTKALTKPNMSTPQKLSETVSEFEVDLILVFPMMNTAINATET